MELQSIGITPRQAAALGRKGIDSVEKLLHFYPRKYNDFRKPKPIEELKHYDGEMRATYGTLVNAKLLHGKHTMARFVNNEAYLSVFWFNQPYRVRYLVPGDIYFIGGQVRWEENYHSATIAAPVAFEAYRPELCSLEPVYPKIKGMSDVTLKKCIELALNHLDECCSDDLSAEECTELGVKNQKQAILAAHCPKNDEDIQAAHKRMIVDTVMPLCKVLAQKRLDATTCSPFALSHGNAAESEMQKKLPYKLTADQHAAIERMLSKMEQGKRLDVLLQGDVGCGKTIVAAVLALATCMEGVQTAIMAPTVVLAEQHYQEFSRLLGQFGYTVGYLHSGMKAKERKTLLSDIASGKVNVVVGTHAVCGNSVQYNCLGLVIIDEEHRFGVEQREQLQEKAKKGVHTVCMSATPIPRSLAIILYGEGTEIINIKTMPSGRKPVTTILYRNEEKVYQSMYNQIKMGRQCYVICPLIEDSDCEVMEEVDSVESTYAKMKSWFKRYPEVTIDSISGNMKNNEVRERIMQFAQGKTHILISTTIVEVGVNVPNATVIMIKNAERFGLAQLHQLRGRVGRSSYQSYCVLLSEKTDSERLQAMVKTTDGFEIAKMDMELRGTGELIGTKQSGYDTMVELTRTHPELYAAVRRVMDKRLRQNATSPEGVDKQ